MVAIENEAPRPQRKKAEMEKWADNDRTPALPAPGQAMQQKKTKTD